MRLFPIAAAALGAAALGLLAGGAAAQPLVPFSSPTQVHHHSLQGRPNAGAATQVKSGPSLMSAPRLGRSSSAPLVPGWASGPALSSLYAPHSLLSAAAFLSPWSPTGPAPVSNAFGAFGANPQAVSGREAAIAVDPTDSNTFYVAAAGGGVWKTTDGGSSYTALTDFLGDTAMGSIAVAPGDRNTLYAGTGEANFSGDCKYGIGLLKSTDGGTSWSVIPGPGNAFVRNAISKIVVDPTNAKTVYLTTAQVVNGVFGPWGVWKTTDGGASWVNTSTSASAIAAGMTTTDSYTSLAIDPSSPQTLYVAIGNPYGPPDASGLNLPEPANGVYKTTDGGATYTKLAGGLPDPSAGVTVGRISIAIAPSSPNTPQHALRLDRRPEHECADRPVQDDGRRRDLYPAHSRSQLPGRSGLLRQCHRRQPAGRKRHLRRRPGQLRRL